MAKPEFAMISLSSTGGGQLLAWVDEKILGTVVTDPSDDAVLIRISARNMRPLALRKSSQFDPVVDGAHGGVDDSR